MTTLPDYFALYGIAPQFSPDAAAVRQQYYALSRQYHPDRIGNNEAAQQKASEINEGYRILLDKDALMGYILKRGGIVEEEEQYKLPPEFLMDMMELNEAIDENPQSVVGNWHLALKNLEAETAPLMLRFDGGERSPELMAALKDFYYRKKYLLRIKERLS